MESGLKAITSSVNAELKEDETGSNHNLLEKLQES
ncbi:unnamed protein product, partial [Adineta steineri]